MNTMTRMLVCTVAMLIALPLFAADEKTKKGKGKKGAQGQQASAMMMKKLESLDLTAEQKEKLEGHASTLNKTMASLRSEGLTQELSKKKAEAMKKAREEGKKGQNVEAEVLASLNLTDDQQAVLKKASAAQTAFVKGIANTLTEEQMGQLPDAVKQQLTRAKGAGGKGAGKKGKAAA
jgi:flagellar biosynthesis/type III secretory pathway protein FliH